MKHWKVSVGLVTAFTAVAGASHAQVIAINNNTTVTGNQAFNGALGLDFNVVSSIKYIQINALGYFDDGRNGVQGTTPITVSLYDRNNTAAPLAQVTFSGTLGTLAPNSTFRFLTLTTPLVLPGNFVGKIVAWGFDATDMENNAFNPGGVTPVFDDGSGSNGGNPVITYNMTNGSYNVSQTYPNTTDDPGHIYNAGSFTFSPLLGTPEPGAVAFFVGMALPGSLLLRRRLRRNK